MKRVPGRELLSNQTLTYPHVEGIYPIDPDIMNDERKKIFRFEWASNNVDELLKQGMICQNCLDIGSCDGYMAVVIAKKKNVHNIPVPIRVDAVEAHDQSWGVCEETAKLSRSKGLHIKTHHVLFEDYQTTDKYDIVIAFEILEHTTDPVSFLGKIYDSMRFGAYLFMTVPEEHGIYGKTDTNEWHYWLFTLQSLVSMFDDTKWRIHQAFELGDLIHIKASKVVP